MTLVVLLPLSVRAQEEINPDPVPVSAGDNAPFSGILLSHKDAAALWQKIETCEKVRQLDASKHEELMEIEKTKCSAQAEVAAKASADRERVLQDALNTCEKEKVRQWYESPQLWGGGGLAVGVAAGIALTVGAVWLGAQARVVVQP